VYVLHLTQKWYSRDIVYLSNSENYYNAYKKEVTSEFNMYLFKIIIKGVKHVP